jgi:hypothetical protein
MVLLTSFQTDSDDSRRRRPRSFGAVVLLCLVLMALLVIVQVAHIHPSETDADHCPLCIAMQSAAPVAMIAIVVVMVRIGRAAPLVEARAVIRHWHPKHVTRPPPSC